jgi:para-nitrobenzyl esterase
MSLYWTNFAKTGDPNGRGLPAWPAFTDTNGRVLYLGDSIVVGGVDGISTLTVLDTVYSDVRGGPLTGRQQ